MKYLRKYKKSLGGLNFFANPDYKALAHLYAELQGGKEQNMQDMSRIAAEEGLDKAYARICMAMEESFPEEDWMIDEFIYRVQAKKNGNLMAANVYQAGTIGAGW